MFKIQFFVLNFIAFLQIPVRIQGSVSTENLFNYGVDAGDSRLPNGDDTFINITLSRMEGFRYFNSTYGNLFVNVNGAISFRQGVSQFTPVCGPLSLPMIVPFWSDVNTNVNGTVFYRESNNRDHLRKASNDIAKAFPHFTGISLGWMLITTWDEVAFFGASVACNGTSLRNTFQVILTTDGTHSFVMFYYNKIEWTTGTASGGNCTGQGGTPAKAGFDLGDSITFYTIPGTCTPEIIDIASTSNINEAGKWIFRVDKEFETVTCENHDENTRLTISPSFVPLLGHVPITLRGPCLANAVSASCLFYDVVQGVIPTEVEGFIQQDQPSVVCQVPYLYSYERINVELRLTLTNASTNTYSGFVYTSIPEGDDLILNINTNLTSLNLTWDPTVFEGFDIGNPTVLQLSLTELDRDKWTERGILAEGFQNTGSYVGSITSTGQDLLNSLASHFVAKVTPMPTAGKFIIVAPSLFSAPQVLKKDQPDTEYISKCRDWYDADNGPPLDTLPCPPTLDQALADQRFSQEGSLLLPFYHPGAEYSFRQRVPSPSGAGSQCAYKNGQILLGPPGGGTADLFSPTFGSGFVNHIREDVYPWVLCCKWSNDDESCRMYYEKRPSDPGNNYVSPNPGNGNGDPHITTFDGLSYMFNGVGEFWMIRSVNNNFLMQARMEQFYTVEGIPTNASIFTAFVIKETRATTNSEVTIQVSVGSIGISVLLDGEAMDFSLITHGTSLSYNGVSITINPDSKLSLSFSSGFAFDFSIADTVALNIIGLAGPGFKGEINGLLGHFDGNLDNDLAIPDGSVLSKDSTLQEIHNDFGLKWITTETESLFVYPVGKTHSDFHYPSFMPSFDFPDLSSIPQDVIDLCGGIDSCLFDFATTGSISLANSTKEITMAVNQTRETISKPVEMCQPLVAPENGFFEAVNFFVGSTATFKCDASYQLSGASTLKCEKNGEGTFIWNGVTPTCRKTNGGGNNNSANPANKGFNGFMFITFTVALFRINY